MSGLYLHLPFCAQKCKYCDFASHTPVNGEISAYVSRLIRHINAESGYRPKTIYIGGGTPSLLPLPEWRLLLDALHRHFDLSTICEWTVEGNPDSITPEWLALLAQSGITRISMGVQAAQEHLLRRLGRIHTFAQAQTAAGRIHQAGLHMNVDLMTGLPDQTMSDWNETLAAGASLSPNHISCYTLQLEPGTPLYAELKPEDLPTDDQTADMMAQAVAYLAADWPRYEISNFAQKQHQSQHNLCYWHNETYLGLGAAAHGCVERDDKRYRIAQPVPAAWLAGSAPEEQLISPLEVAWETLMLGLRLTQGISLAEYRQRHDIDLAMMLGDVWAFFVSQGLAADDARRWRLTNAGLAVQNAILLRLMQKWDLTMQHTPVILR